MEASRRNARIVAYIDLMFVVIEVLLSLIPAVLFLIVLAVPILFDEDFKCQIPGVAPPQPPSLWPFGRAEPIETLKRSECFAILIIGVVVVWFILVAIFVYGYIVVGLLEATDKASRISKAERTRKVQHWITFSIIKLPLTVFAVVFGPCHPIWLVPQLPLLYFVWGYYEHLTA